MTDKFKPKHEKFSQQIGDIAARKVKAQREVTQTIWTGLGMVGLVGWSIVVPTLLGAALGMWLDDIDKNPARSWTLALMMVGIITGCVHAWYWIDKESKTMTNNEDEE